MPDPQPDPQDARSEGERPDAPRALPPVEQAVSHALNTEGGPTALTQKQLEADDRASAESDEDELLDDYTEDEP